MHQKCANICCQMEYIRKKTILKSMCPKRYMLNCSAAFFYIVAHFLSHPQIDKSPNLQKILPNPRKFSKGEGEMHTNAAELYV